MKQLPPLDQRLGLISSLIRKDSVVADIGTDHGLLIIYLALCKKISYGYACDINSAPLAVAKENILRYHVGDRVECIQCNGLLGLPPDVVQDIVIAGMGGDLIFDILSAVDWVKKKETHLILQPMTHISKLRQSLCGTGYRIVEEHPVVSGRFVYTIMLCRYEGVPLPCSMEYSLLGELPHSTSPLKFRYYRRMVQNLSATIEQMQRGCGMEEEVALRIQALEQIEKRIQVENRITNGGCL